MTIHSSSSSAASTFVTAAAAVAAVAAISLSVLQTDSCSRVLLSSKSLQRKRIKEYLYRWDWTLKKAVLRGARQGHDQRMDRSNTEVFWKDEDIQDFIQRLQEHDEISILSMEVDDDDRDYYIFFKHAKTGHLYQLPLVKFGMALAESMDNQLTTTALTLIADASSGLGGTLLTRVITECKAGVVRLVNVWVMNVNIALSHRSHSYIFVGCRSRTTLDGTLCQPCRKEYYRTGQDGTHLVWPRSIGSMACQKTSW